MITAINLVSLLSEYGLINRCNRVLCSRSDSYKQHRPKTYLMENWKPIKGYEGLYEVSDLGNVRSVDRTISIGNHKRRYKGKLLSPAICPLGYKCVVLSKKGKGRFIGVHQLVAQAFLNHTINGSKIVVDHINDNSSDNRAENLQILTARQNTTKHARGRSKYVGVSFCKGDKKWRALIIIEKKRIFLGNFDTEIEAHEAYQNKLKSLT